MPATATAPKKKRPPKPPPLNVQIDREWSRQASGVQVDVLNIPRIFRYVADRVQAGQTVEAGVAEAIRMFRINRPLIVSADSGGRHCQKCGNDLLSYTSRARNLCIRCEGPGYVAPVSDPAPDLRLYRVSLLFGGAIRVTVNASNDDEARAKAILSASAELDTLAPLIEGANAGSETGTRITIFDDEPTDPRIEVSGQEDYTSEGDDQ